MNAIKSGFVVSRSQMRAGMPSVALPERGSTPRLEVFSTSVKDLGNDRMAYVAELTKLWSEAKERFLTIGRYLVQAKAKLPHGSYEAMVVADLPFGKNVAWQLRTIAEEVDRGRVAEHELPASYATAFKVVKMDDTTLAKARQEIPSVVRVNVTREEVGRFLRRLSEEAQGAKPRVDVLATRRAVLQRRLRTLLAEQRNIERELADIETELGIKPERNSPGSMQSGGRLTRSG
jgi:hypothetical protein